MDNKAIAGILYETADLLEIDGQDSFRIRSYRNAAEAIEALPQQVMELISEPKKLLAVPGFRPSRAFLICHIPSAIQEGLEAGGLYLAESAEDEVIVEGYKSTRRIVTPWALISWIV